MNPYQSLIAVASQTFWRSSDISYSALLACVVIYILWTPLCCIPFNSYILLEGETHQPLALECIILVDCNRTYSVILPWPAELLVIWGMRFMFCNNPETAVIFLIVRQLPTNTRAHLTLKIVFQKYKVIE